MTKLLFSITIAVLVAACSEHDVPSCTVQCAVDADCPGGLSCDALGLCTSGEVCTCTAGQFLACTDPSTAKFCNASANGVEMDECGAAGCNANAGRCNSCLPSAVSCSADSTKLDHCDADGLPAASDDCRLGCVAANASTDAHCGHIQPMFLPDVCNTAATTAELTLGNATLDTSSDSTCNGGIVPQMMGPEICVVRYGAIRLASGITKIRGARAVAFVADDAIEVGSTNTLDASADGTSNGPGGGTVVSGVAANSNRGGGGAGFRVSGGAGGSTANGGGGAGGDALDPLANPIRLVGGPRPPRFIQDPVIAAYAEGGGGGGAVTLISCRGTVSVFGIIDVGGGGGAAGGDTFPAAVGNAVNFGGGGGGGAGGYLAIQAPDVRGNALGVFANGGGGGGGCSVDECTGNPGQDGTRSGTAAQGGAPAGTGGRGGSGGTAQSPTVGLASGEAPGGGGGASGRLQIFIPETGTVMNTPPASPPFEANRTIPVR